MLTLIQSPANLPPKTQAQLAAATGAVLSIASRADPPTDSDSYVAPAFHEQKQTIGAFGNVKKDAGEITNAV